MMQDLPTITPPTDISPGGIINWLLGALCAIVVFLWKLNEGKNSKAIADLDDRLKASDLKHSKCEDDRNRLACEQASLTERLNQLEKQFVHGSG
jgi:hypothetical protein